MRAVNLGPGEIADRLTILALKVAHAGEQGKDATHFVNERNALLTMLRSFDLGGTSMEWIFSLAAINGMLWYAEDELRAYRGPTTTTPGNTIAERLARADVEWLQPVAACAFRIQSLNDQRAELVWALNKQAGNDLGREKLND